MSFSFIKYSKIWIGFSSLLIAIGLVAMINNWRTIGTPLLYGIDFTGGSLMEVRFTDASITGDQTKTVYEAIETALPDTVKQITLTDQNSYIIQGRELTNEQHNQVIAGLSAAIGPLTETRFTIIGPKISETLKQKALVALGVASVAIVVYIAFAFRRVPKRVSPWRFGLCAVIALIHDIVATIGFFALLRYEVDALFITALLTIMGFSVHDTIVVFDRIRENLKKQTRDQTFGQIADLSLNETVGRSVNTSLSTLITLTALYFFGAESIRNFVLALIFGITVGTYSSIFIASPILTWWQEKSRMR